MLLQASRYRFEILPVKAGSGYFARLVPLSPGTIGNPIDGPSFPTETAVLNWLEGRSGLRV